MPKRRHVRITRQAISPRFATRTLARLGGGASVEYVAEATGAHTAHGDLWHFACRNGIDVLPFQDLERLLLLIRWPSMVPPIVSLLCNCLRENKRRVIEWSHWWDACHRYWHARMKVSMSSLWKEKEHFARWKESFLTLYFLKFEKVKTDHERYWLFFDPTTKELP